MGPKYLILRQDGSQPEWPGFVLGAPDPAAAIALRAYADACEKQGRDPRYVEDVRALAQTFDAYREEHGASKPDAVPDRTPDPAVMEQIKSGNCSQ